MTTTPAVLDLDADRSERAKARAAQHEGSGATLPVRFGGQMIADLGAEFPMSVLAPLTELDVDIAYVIRSLVSAAQAQAREEQINAADLLANVLTMAPSLPFSIVKAAMEIGRRLLGEEGYEAFTALSPTPWDIRALVKGVLGWYGMSLGEFLGSATPSPVSGGETSKPTSKPNTAGSTRGASGSTRKPKGSLAPAGS